jgi:Aminotransferase class-III
VFACEHFDLDPDMLCVAKAMSGGLAPIGAVIATAPVATSMEENDGTFYSTYGWHPRSVAAAITTLRGLKANRRRLLAGVAEMSEYFRVRLLQLEFDRPAAVRIQGLANRDRCRRRGLRGRHPRQVPPQRAARVDRRIDGAAAAVAGDRQADRRERAGHSGALDMMRRGPRLSSAWSTSAQ